MPSDDIDEIRRSLDVAREIKHSATDWTDQSGGDRIGRCTHPVHGHTSSGGGTPNLIVTQDDAWYCYSHSTGGGIFEWVAVEEGICSCRDLPLSDEQFKDVLPLAAERAGVELTGPAGADTYQEAAEEGSLSDDQLARFALDEAVDILHDNLDTLIGDQTVRGLVKDRRPFDDDTIDRARIGYLDDQAHAELLDRLSTDALEDIGILRDNGSLHGRGRIIYPYLGDGRPRYWVGRKTPESDLDAKYLKPNSDTTVFEQPIYSYTPQRPKQGEGVWIVEGIQDAISLAQAGNVRAISAVATNPSPEQMNQLVGRAQEAERAVVCFDADDGGQGDSIELAIDIMSAGVQTDIAELPSGMDPNDYFLDGGQFDDIQVTPAAKYIIDQRGDSDPLIERLLDTVKPETARAERLVDSISDVTPIRKPVLRKMMTEDREYESQRGWREPSLVKKYAGAEARWGFVYPDGTEIEMESISDRGAPQTFSDKYGRVFNFFPEITRSEWLEMVNEWMNEVRVEEVSPLSEEGQVREAVQVKIQMAEAVKSTDDLSAVGAETIVHDKEAGEVQVPSYLLEDWIDKFEVSLRKAAEYLDPLMAGNTTRMRVDGTRVRFWRFDTTVIDGNGYYVPEPEDTPDDPVDEEREAL